MSGVRCKIIIDGGFAAAQAALLEALRMDSTVEALGKEKHAELVQAMADWDIAHYHGGTIKGGLAWVMEELEAAGVYSPDVFEIFARPGGGPGLLGGAPV